MEKYNCLFVVRVDLCIYIRANRKLSEEIDGGEKVEWCVGSVRWWSIGISFNSEILTYRTKPSAEELRSNCHPFVALKISSVYHLYIQLVCYDGGKPCSSYMRSSKAFPRNLWEEWLCGRFLNLQMLYRQYASSIAWIYCLRQKFHYIGELWGYTNQMKTTTTELQWTRMKLKS